MPAPWSRSANRLARIGRSKSPGPSPPRCAMGRRSGPGSRRRWRGRWESNPRTSTCVPPSRSSGSVRYERSRWPASWRSGSDDRSRRPSCMNIRRSRPWPGTSRASPPKSRKPPVRPLIVMGRMGRSRSSASAAGSPAPAGPTPSGGSSATGSTPWARSPRGAGTTACGGDGAGSSIESTASTRISSALPRVRPPGWTPSSASCWRSPGRPWKTPASRPRRSRGRRWGCSSASRRMTTGGCKAAGTTPAMLTSSRATPPAWRPIGSRTPSTSGGRAWRSTRPVRRRWWPCNRPVGASARGNRPWRSRAA